MSESQSRYSIVERLTNKKMSLLDEEDKLDREIESKKQELESLSREIVSWEQNAKEKIAREKREKENQLETIKSEIEFYKTLKDGKSNKIAEKLKVVDSALEKLELISKAANEQ